MAFVFINIHSFIVCHGSWNVDKPGAMDGPEIHFVAAWRMSEIEFGIKIEQSPIFLDRRQSHTFHLATENFSICAAGPQQKPAIK